MCKVWNDLGRHMTSSLHTQPYTMYATYRDQHTKKKTTTVSVYKQEEPDYLVRMYAVSREHLLCFSSCKSNGQSH